MPLKQANSFLDKPPVELDATFVSDASGENLAASLDAGLAPVFGEDSAVVLGDANHSVLKVDMQTRAVSVYAREATLSQPNDIAIGANDIVYASDPNWPEETGRMFKVGTDGIFALMEDGMGTTNGIEVSIRR